VFFVQCTLLYFTLLYFSCRSSVDFSIKVAWLLGAYSSDVRKPNWRNSQGIKLKKMILNDELKYVGLKLVNVILCDYFFGTFI